LPILSSRKAPCETPEKIGIKRVNGKVQGDSGYALEEVLFGGRLRHRRSKKAHFFQARINPTIIA
jgi:hypothetical protein